MPKLRWIQWTWTQLGLCWCLAVRMGPSPSGTPAATALCSKSTATPGPSTTRLSVLVRLHALSCQTAISLVKTMSSNYFQMVNPEFNIRLSPVNLHPERPSLKWLFDSFFCVDQMASLVSRENFCWGSQINGSTLNSQTHICYPELYSCVCISLINAEEK